MPKPSIGRMTLALPLLYGAAPALVGCGIMREWAAESTALVVSGAVLLLSGAIMVVSAVWLLISLGHRRSPLWSGGLASLLSAGVFAAVTVSHMLPCSGPA